MNPRRNVGPRTFSCFQPVSPEIAEPPRRPKTRLFGRKRDDLVGVTDFLPPLQNCDSRNREMEAERKEEDARRQAEERDSSVAHQSAKLASALWRRERERRLELEKEGLSTLTDVDQRGFKDGSESMERELGYKMKQLEEEVAKWKQECKRLEAEMKRQEDCFQQREKALQRMACASPCRSSTSNRSTWPHAPADSGRSADEVAKTRSPDARRGRVREKLKSLREMLSQKRPELATLKIRLLNYLDRNMRPDDQCEHLLECVVNWAKAEDFIMRVDKGKVIERRLAATITIQRFWRERIIVPIQPSCVASNSSINLEYRAAFEQAGGHKLPTSTWAKQLNEVLAELERARECFSGAQDCAYEILGLDDLYRETQARNDKMQREVKRLAHVTNGDYYAGKVKDRSRSRVKCLTKYGNDTSMLTDLMRASIIYDDMDRVFQAVVTMVKQDLTQQREDFLIVQVEDRIHVPMGKSEYRDIKMLVRVDGLVGELQLHMRPLFDCKSAGHKLYSTERQIEETIFEAVVHNHRYATTLVQQYPAHCSVVKDKNWRRALHYAALSDAQSLTRALIVANANPWVEDKDDTIPLDLSLHRGFVKESHILLTAMASNIYLRGKNNNLLRAAKSWVDLMTCDPPCSTSVRVLNWDEHMAFNPLRMKAAKTLGKKLFAVLPESTRAELSKMLQDAARMGEAGRIRYLLYMGVENREVALDLAIGHGKIDCVNEFMEYIPRPYHKSDFHLSEVARKARPLTSDNEGRRSHSIDAIRNRLRAAVRAGANVNMFASPYKPDCANDRTPLMLFASYGDVECLQVLLDARADVHAIDAYGAIAEDYAHAQRFSDCAELLLPHRDNSVANPRSRIPEHTLETRINEILQSGCSGALWRLLMWKKQLAEGKTFSASEWSTIHFSVSRRAKENDPRCLCLRVLLHFNVDANTVDKNGWSAMHYAGLHGNEEAFEVLMRAGGDPELPNASMQTPTQTRDQKRRVLDVSDHAKKLRTTAHLRFVFISWQHAWSTGIRYRQVVQSNIESLRSAKAKFEEEQRREELAASRNPVVPLKQQRSNSLSALHSPADFAVARVDSSKVQDGCAKIKRKKVVRDSNAGQAARISKIM